MTSDKRVRPEKGSDLPPAERAREIALGILSRAPRPESYIRAALSAKEIPGDVIDEVIARYIEVGLLDDDALAAQIARTRHQERGASARAIRMELQRKGFTPASIDAAVAPIDAQAEEAAARALARRAWDRTAGLDVQVRARRVVGHVGRKGYSPALAFALVKELISADTQDGPPWE